MKHPWLAEQKAQPWQKNLAFVALILPTQRASKMLQIQWGIFEL